MAGAADLPAVQEQQHRAAQQVGQDGGVQAGAEDADDDEDGQRQQGGGHHLPAGGQLLAHLVGAWPVAVVDPLRHKAGVPLGIMASDGTIYVPVSSKPGDPQNSKLEQFIEGKVKVTGTHRMVGGLHTIEIKTVSAAT